MRRALVVLAFALSLPAMAQDLVSLVVNEGRLVDLVRIAYGELSKEPYILGHEVLESQDLFTVDLRNVSTARAVSSIADLVHSAGFEVRKRGGVVWIGKAQEQADELIVYRPKHRSARYLADVVQSVTAARSVLARSIKPVESKTMPISMSGSQSQAPGVNQLSPTSVEGQIDRSEVDQIAFNVAPKDAAKVRKLLADLDTPSGEVVLKAAVYEVGVTKSEGSAVQLAIKLAGVSASLSGIVLSGGSIKFAQGGIEAVLSALDADVRFKSVSRASSEGQKRRTGPF